MEELERQYLATAKDSNEYFSVRRYLAFILRKFNNEDYEPSRELASGHQGAGLKASSICQDRDISVGSEIIRDGKRINTYPEKILAEVLFGDSYPDIFPDYEPDIKNRYPTPPRI